MHPTFVTNYSTISGLTGLVNIPTLLSLNDKNNITEESAYIHEPISDLKNYNRIARFPLFLATAVSLYYPLFENYHYVTHSFVGLSVVSLLYFSDTTPKQFEKDPFWKRALDYAKEKAEEMLPQPIPLPIPIPKAYRMQETPSL